MNLYDGKMAVEIAGIKMKTPVMTASGTFGFGLEFADFVDLNKLGALVVKAATLNPCLGNGGQRTVETPAGMLNSIGLENPGCEAFVQKTLPYLAKYDVPVIVNIAGTTPEEYAAIAKILDVPGVAGLELNISCPNVKEGGMAFGTCPGSAASVVKAVKAATKKPVITKLSPNVTDIAEMARAVEDAGSDAISLINTLIGMKIDIKRKCPVLGNIVGGLSGPAIRPVAVRMMYQVAQAVKVPLIGMGGIMNSEDALEFILAGATAVAVGTGNFVNPAATEEVTQGILSYLERENCGHISDLRGRALPGA